MTDIHDKKHGNINPMDCMDTSVIEELEEDAKYSETIDYWKIGNIGTIYQMSITSSTEATFPKNLKLKKSPKHLR